MEIINLKTLKAVVDEGGIKGASVKLNTVQSNITSRIQKLEQELEINLFHLEGRKLKLTPSGQQLYSYAVKILQLEYQARQSILQNKGSYELTIGMPETFAAVHMPLALKQLKHCYPLIRPQIHTDTSARLVTALLNNNIDCALVANAPLHEGLVALPIVEEQLVEVTPIEDGYEPVLFVREEGCGYRACALNWQQQEGRNDETMMVLSSADGVLGSIAAGLGYTIISKNMVQGSRYEHALKLKPVSHGQRTMMFSLVYRKECALEDGILKLADMFPNTANKTTV